MEGFSVFKSAERDVAKNVTEGEPNERSKAINIQIEVL